MASDGDIVSTSIGSSFWRNCVNNWSFVLLDLKSIFKKDIIESVFDPNIVDIGVDELDQSSFELDPVDLAT